MCGLAGMLRFDDQRPAPERLRRMLAHLRHRGPDGEGVSEHGPCALVHARLSIIDLLSGQQPMHLPPVELPVGQSGARVASHGPLHLVFNGEIYNHRELRAKLERHGHRFKSDHSDTEVLLFGFRQWGTMLPKHLHGMWAFAIWDEADQRLFLCRDRTGKKPLYLRRTPSELSFASLVATLIVGAEPGFSPGQSPAAMRNYLRFGYPFAQSMVEGIEELRPAHWMTVHRDGTTVSERYWQPPPISRHSTALGAVEALREVLSDAVADRLEADVPLACFLSGGIDSSVVAAIAQRRLAARGERLQTFSVAMPDLDYDESPHAQAVADHIGAQHTVLQTHPGDAIGDLRRLMAVTGEPTADSSLLPTFWLCRAARQHVKVALSGDGGDELFGGYDRYRALRLLSRWRGLMASVPEGLLADANPRSTRTRLRRLVQAARAGLTPAQQYAQMIHLFTTEQLRELMPDTADEANSGVPDWPEDISGTDRVHAAMRWDLEHYLPYEVLRKVDRASMAVALEVRCPLLDTQVCDLAGHLPTSVLMPGGRPKGLLRALATELVPLTIVNRPKRGFAVPIGGWFRTMLRDALADHLFDGSLPAMGLSEAPVRQMFDEHVKSSADHTHRLFALLQLSLWRAWLREPALPPAGL